MATGKHVWLTNLSKPIGQDNGNLATFKKLRMYAYVLLLFLFYGLFYKYEYLILFYIIWYDFFCFFLGKTNMSHKKITCSYMPTFPRCHLVFFLIWAFASSFRLPRIYHGARRSCSLSRWFSAAFSNGDGEPCGHSPLATREDVKTATERLERFKIVNC